MMITALKSYPWHRQVIKAGEDYDLPEKQAKQLIAGKLAKAADPNKQKQIEEVKKAEEKKLETPAPNRASRRAAVAPKNLTSEDIVTAPRNLTTEVSNANDSPHVVTAQTMPVEGSKE